MCEVWPENWETLQVFCAMGTQWRIVAGLAGERYQGLDYAALPAVWEALGIAGAARRGIFEGLQVMEREAKAALNVRR